MSMNLASIQSLRRVFRHSFSAHDITESLVSCEKTAPAAETRQFMEEHAYEVIGVRDQGLVVGYLQRESLTDGLCADHINQFDPAHVVVDTVPLADVVLGLRTSPRLFVSVFGRIGGIVTRSDLQKPPVRMWLFGLVTLIEMRITRMIENVIDGEEWRDHISAGRLAKAEQLLVERARVNQNLDLLNCLQFGDKVQILARNQRLRTLTRFESASQVKDIGKRLERLRNNLAHAQDIVTSDWDSIVDLAENLDDLLEGPLNADALD